MRVFVSLFLVFCFGVIVSPISIWHAHDHETTEKSFSKQAGETSLEEDCFVCDFDLGLFTSAGHFSYQLHFKHLYSYNSGPLLAYAGKSISVITLRGPPAFI